MQMIAILLALCAAIIGLFVFLKPALTIEIQRKFYACINWRMEPISMQKEIRNTKIMGVFLFAFAIVTILFIMFNGSI